MKQITVLIESPKKYKIVDLIEFILTDILNIEDVNLIIKYDDRVLNKYSTADVQLEALLDKSPLPHYYTLLVRSDTITPLYSILCHEMCHLHQYERGDLQKKSMTEYIGKGTLYNSNTKYEDRPGEQEAFEMQRKYGKRFKNEKL